MKRRFLSVKELAEELGVHEDTIYRAHLKKLIPVKKVYKVLRFDLQKVLKAFGKHASDTRPKQSSKRASGGAHKKCPRTVKRGAIPGVPHGGSHEFVVLLTRMVSPESLRGGVND